MPFGVGSVSSYWGRSDLEYFDPDMLLLVRSLHRAGYKLGLASNSRARWILPALKLTNLETAFDIVVTPEDAVLKPDDAFYALLAERCGAQPGEILFIDDRSRNIRGAEIHGMRAIHFKNYSQLMTKLRDQGIKIPTKSET